MKQFYCPHCGKLISRILRTVSHETQTNLVVNIESECFVTEKPLERTVDSVNFRCFYCDRILSITELLRMLGEGELSKLLTLLTLKDHGKILP